MRSGQPNLLTFRQRLDKIGYQGEIPAEYTDQYISCDVMDYPVKINGKFIMDHKNLLIHFGNKINAWRERTKDGAHYYDIKDTPVLETIAGGFEALQNIENLNDLRDEIEGWVFKLELEFKIKQREIGKDSQLKLLDKKIKQTSASIDKLLESEADDVADSENEQQINTLLLHLDILNKESLKITKGIPYYDQPEVLHYEISRLFTKQEKGELSEDDKKELELCLERLDKNAPSKQPFLRRFHPGLFGLTRLAPESDDHEAGIPILSFPALHNERNGDL